MKPTTQLPPRRRSMLLALASLGLGAQAQAQDVSAPATDPRLAGLVADLRQRFGDLDAVVVRQAGRTLLAWYKTGAAPAEVLRDTQSVTKSVLSLLVGAAIARGAITSVDQPVAELLSGVLKPDDLGSQPGLRVRHLLTMTAGFALGRAPQGGADDARYLMARPVKAPPGAVFAYDNLAANLLAIALAAAMKTPVADFARSALFGPLGITAFEWATGANGYHFGSQGLQLRTADMARIGELVLRGGAWAGAQLVPADYVRAATSVHNAGGPPVGAPYGYLWWVDPAAPGGGEVYASGFGGQTVWLHRGLDAVVAIHAPARGDVMSRGHAAGALRAIAAKLR